MLCATGAPATWVYTDTESFPIQTELDFLISDSVNTAIIG